MLARSEDAALGTLAGDMQAGTNIDMDAQQGMEAAATLRREYSPRHVPDKIYLVDDIPTTLTGKKLEVPVRRILMGVPVEKAANRDAVANPKSLDYFIEYAKTQSDYSL